MYDQRHCTIYIINLLIHIYVMATHILDDCQRITYTVLTVYTLVASISVIQKQGNALKLWCIIPQPSLTIIVNELSMSRTIVIEL